MRCNTHPFHSGIGVCAFCLRERLSALTSPKYDEVSSPEYHRNPKPSSAHPTPPPPLCHPSPFSNVSGKNRNAKRFSLLSPIWGYPSPKKAQSAAGFSKSSGSNNSWVLALGLGRKMRNKKASPHVQPLSGRGMSPATEQSPGRGVSIPSPLWRKQSPHRFSSFGLCLSPMMRPIAGNRREHAPPETAFSGEFRGTFSRRCGSGGGAMAYDLPPGLITNRSRKLVDLGKVW
ncbi:uncharacterized protein LOC110030347 [Phalaenopsis equestris]|uniref:uncharacterized protein LOC110030347 n=1 Tax=Phalaenopsis equestris TaxID=78828 RepID=UPI0009E29836|nr:uncharacterized protein LOC110030347 [Phalaenopsis equestris]